MNRIVIDKLIGVLVVPFGLALILVPYSLLIGWNLVSLLLFWFVAIPTLAIFLPAKLSKSTNQLLKSILGVTVFYAIMVFMIYEHVKTDYFQIMIASFVVNVIIVLLVKINRKPGTVH